MKNIICQFTIWLIPVIVAALAASPKICTSRNTGSYNGSSQLFTSCPACLHGCNYRENETVLTIQFAFWNQWEHSPGNER